MVSLLLRVIEGEPCQRYGFDPSVVQPRADRSRDECWVMMRELWSRQAGAVHRLIGVIPYSFKVKSGLELKKEDGYRVTKNSPYVSVQMLSLDRVWQTTFKRGWRWKTGAYDPRGILMSGFIGRQQEGGG